MSNAKPIAAIVQISHWTGVSRGAMRNYVPTSFRAGPTSNTAMRPRSRSVALLCLATALLLHESLRADRAALDVARLLDLYGTGRFDEALRAVESATEADAQQLRQRWRIGGRLWIDAEPLSTSKSHRLLTAAAFALETEHLRAERGQWAAPMAGVCVPPPKQPGAKSPPGPCVLEWAMALLQERGAPDDAERAWYLAAAALAGGVRDWRFLYRVNQVSVRGMRELVSRGLLAEALLRFPDDARLRLEKGIAVSARYNVTTDGGGPVSLPGLIVIQGAGTVSNAYDARADAIEIFSKLADDPDVGAEAHLRLGYLYWATGEAFQTRTELLAAAKAAKTEAGSSDPAKTDLQYLTHFLLGWTSLQDNRPEDAIRELQASLEARPHSQSSVLALASLELQRGEAARAQELTRASLQARPTDADPWRLFLYGHYPQWPRLIAELRSKVAR